MHVFNCALWYALYSSFHVYGRPASDMPGGTSNINHTGTFTAPKHQLGQNTDNAGPKGQLFFMKFILLLFYFFQFRFFHCGIPILIMKQVKICLLPIELLPIESLPIEKYNNVVLSRPEKVFKF